MSASVRLLCWDVSDLIDLGNIYISGVYAVALNITVNCKFSVKCCYGDLSGTGGEQISVPGRAGEATGSTSLFLGDLRFVSICRENSVSK